MKLKLKKIAETKYKIFTHLVIFLLREYENIFEDEIWKNISKEIVRFFILQ